MKGKRIPLILSMLLMQIISATAVMAQKTVYMASQLRNEGGDLSDPSRQWCYQRSLASDNVIVFWENGYGDNHPNSTAVPSTYRVDVEDLVAKLEIFYEMNVNTLKFAKVGEGVSNLDRYKMIILLHYTTDWYAYGGGFDDVIGGMWISPSTCKPVGSTIAHELGHSFQYQVYCDYLRVNPTYNPNAKEYGFRYETGQGNCYWEATAQWQAHQNYPEQIFYSTHFLDVFSKNCQSHPYHEWQRYASYFIHEYMAYKRGIDVIGRIWRESVKPEDASQTYMRLFYGHISNYIADFNEEMYDMASRFVTWDIPSLRELGRNYVGYIATPMNRVGKDESGLSVYRVDASRCIQMHGFNHIELNVPTHERTITVNFEGVAGIDGYCNYGRANAGWHYGFVALQNDGTRVYSQINKATYSLPTDTATFEVPENTSRLWMVVLGAPRIYQRHNWDEDASNDGQWPYQVSFRNTNILGEVEIEFDSSDVAHSATLVYDVELPISSSTYEAFTYTIDPTPLCKAFLMQKSEIIANLGRYNSTKKIRFYNANADGTTVNYYTTNTTGGWYTIEGDVCSYGEPAIAYCDFDMNTLAFTLGRYPGKPSAGQQMSIRQKLVLNRLHYVTIQFNITFVAESAAHSITRAEVIDDYSTDIHALKNSFSSSVDVYDTHGHFIKRAASKEEAVAGLKKGLYLLNGEKFYVK